MNVAAGWNGVTNMSTIIVPLDGSSFNERTFRTVQSLSQSLGSNIELLHVLQIGSKRAKLRDRVAAERYLNRIAASFHGSRIDTNIVEGRPSGQILQRIEEVEDSIVVLKTGPFGQQLWHLGSGTEQEILRRSSAPVVAVYASGAVPNREIRRFLVPLDGSALAESIMPLTAALAIRSRATVQLVWVEDLERISRVYDFAAISSGEGASIVGQSREQVDEAARRYLVRQAEYLASHGIEVGWTLLYGDIASQINRTAWIQSSDLILMATHGRSRLGVLALGSITQQVLSHSKAPVLILSPRARERKAQADLGRVAVAA